MRALLLALALLAVVACQGRTSVDTNPRVPPAHEGEGEGSHSGEGEGEGSHSGEGEGEGSHSGEGEGEGSHPGEGEGEGTDDQGCTITIEIKQPLQCPSP